MPFSEIPPEITAFLREQHVMSLATVASGELWAASLFYCLDESGGRLLYFTEEKTTHGRLSRANPRVTATIAPQERHVERIRGVQLRGTTTPLDGAEADQARRLFATTFPEVGAAPAPIWALTPAYLKFVDNSQGFGHKVEWPGPAA